MQINSRWRRQRVPDENLETAVYNLLALSGVSVTQATTAETIRSHPRYPSLGAARDALHDWGLTAAAFRVDDALWDQIPLPALVHLHDDGGRFVIVQRVDAGGFRVLDPSSGWNDVPRADFLAQSSGATLVLDPPAQSAGERDFELQRRRERQERARQWVAWVAASVLALLAFSSFAIAAGANGRLWSLFALQIIGGGLSIALLQLQRDRSLPLIDRICSTRKNSGCQKVLRSSAASFLGVSMGEWGAMYFAGGGLALVIASLPSILEPVAVWVAVLSVAATPYSVFSLYYQGVVLRSWCILCSAVQTVVIAQVVWFVLASGSLLETTIAAPSIALSGFCLVAGAWLFLRSTVQRSRESERWRYQYRRLRQDPVVLRALLEQVPAVDLPCLAGDVEIGDATAAHELLVITHPHCGHCRRAHRQVQALVQRFPALLKLRFRFFGQQQQLGSFQAVEPILVHQLAGDSVRARRALTEAFVPGGAAATDSRSPHDPEVKAAWDTMQEWAVASGLRGTPTYFFDGRKIPATVELSDLAFLLNGLATDSE